MVGGEIDSYGGPYGLAERDDGLGIEASCVDEFPTDYKGEAPTDGYFVLRSPSLAVFGAAVALLWRIDWD